MGLLGLLWERKGGEAERGGWLFFLDFFSIKNTF